MKRKLSIIIFVLMPLMVFSQERNEKKLISSDLEENKNNWVSQDFEKNISIELDAMGVFMPYFLSVNENGDIGLLDWSQRSIFIIRKGNYSEIEKIGGNKGRGPGEYESPFDIYLSDDDKILISDIESRKIDIWDTRQKKLLHSFKLEERFVKPDKVVICEEEGEKFLYVLSTQYGYGYEKQLGILHKYNVLENSILIKNTFQEIEDDNERYPYVITGQISCAENSGVYYSGDFTGTIRKYSKEGELLFISNASYKVEEPLFIKTKKDHTQYNPKAPRINGEMFLVGEYLIVGHSRKKDRYIYGIDYYSSKTGEYIKSVKLPVPAKEIGVSNNKLYLIEYRDKDGFNLNIYDFK